jgi:peptide/nickel transport system ATP-binding protein
MAQRLAVAAARAGGARIVIADEPTKGLDAALRDDVAALLLSGMGETGGLLVITHDLALARRLGGRVIVLRAGAVVERGSTGQVFATPKETFTKEFFAADPERWTPRRPVQQGGAAVVAARDLALSRGGRTLFEDVSVEVMQGGVFGVTGPSGCGKSSLGDALLGLIQPTRGTVSRDSGAHPHAFQKLYQDPVAAFPRKRALGRTIADTARLSGVHQDEVETLLDRLGLEAGLLARPPGAVSGGELQRLSLLRVLLRRPSFVFADEPSSRLDPITQARVIALLTATTERDGVALMLVSHDAALIRKTADTVLALRVPGAVDAPDTAPGRRIASGLH